MRLDFMLFRDVSALEDCPDDTTTCRFRIAFAKAVLNAAIIDEVNRQPTELGLKTKNVRTAVVDATVIDRAARPGDPGGKVDRAEDGTDGADETDVDREEGAGSTGRM